MNSRKKYSICIILIYYGKFNSWFDLWLRSVKNNLTIDFIIVTDIEIKFKVSSNIKIYNISFHKLKQKIQNVFDKKICLNKYYKLCDFRPFYGKIFEDLLYEYDFWGYCDCDLIFGDIRKFITNSLLEKYDKLLDRGHLTLFKNKDLVNISPYKIRENKISYIDVVNTPYNAHFDESPTLDYIMKSQDISCYYNRNIIGDINYNKFKFELFGASSKSVYFSWENGKVFVHSLKKDAPKKELLYVHLQKRLMVNKLKKSDYNYYIIPNYFISYDEKVLNEELQELQTNYFYIVKSYFKSKKRSILNLFKGALVFRIKGK